MTSQLDSEYATALRASSDRVRWALYVVLAATAFVALNHYNVQAWSWPSRRLATWYKLDTARAIERQQIGEQLRMVREEYLRQYVSRYVLASSSFLGLAIDVNDLGTVGGLFLTLAMLILNICLSREHEVVVVTLRRLRAVPERGKDDPDAIDRANDMYHLLAITQILSSPPTAARWQNRGAWNHLASTLFLPMCIHAWVVAGNWRTYPLAQSYGISMMPLMILQIAMLIILALLTVASWLHIRAMSIQWHKAFFQINPDLRTQRQSDPLRWFHLLRRR